MKALSQSTAQVVSKNCSRKFIAVGKIVQVWPQIIGEKLAAEAVPVRIQYSKPSSKRAEPEAVLYIETSSAYSTSLHYQKDVLLERISQLFGAGWITDIRIKVHAGKMPAKVKKNAAAPLTKREKNHLSELLGALDDSDMADRLQRLGEGIIRRENS